MEHHGNLKSRERRLKPKSKVTFDIGHSPSNVFLSLEYTTHSINASTLIPVF